MNKKFFVCASAGLTLLILGVAPLASAHGHTSFEIHEQVYSFTVGSLNEPIAVDDKSGLDLRVVSMAHHNDAAGDHAGTPVSGLEKTLKVELMAGGKKKTLDLLPAFNDPGAYKAYFIPTVQTTFSYRLFGTIDNVPFDYTFSCNPAGHPQTPEDKTETKISEGVMRIEAAGAFSCPTAKADLGFPEASVSAYDLNVNLKSEISEGKVTAANSAARANLGIVLGVLGLLAGAGAWMKGKKAS